MKNLEAKFRLNDPEGAEAKAVAIGYERRAVLNQRDTFFRVAHGKLKMREENGRAVLIFYHRDQSGSLMLSNYEITPVADPDAIRRMLGEANGKLAIVEKVRTLLIRDNVRLHLDRVNSLGEFGEIEGVLADGDSLEHTLSRVDQLISALGVAQPDLIDISYFEMLAKC